MSRWNPKALSTDAVFAGGPARSSCEAAAVWGGGGAKGPAHQACSFVQPGRELSREEAEKNMSTSNVKPFVIPKQMVWEAYRRVAANKGAPGVDSQTLGEFEADLKDNLYKIWNRMSSGSYFPLPVRGVEIPKSHGGGVRLLGVPTVADRVAQTVVARYLEERAEPRFHRDSYGYRPGRAAWDAVGVCRQRCWRYDWVIDLDVQKFFDSVPWDLVVKAVEAITDTPWVLLYVKRWLAAPLQRPDGTLVERVQGTPQGSAVSPILANLFMHYAFDRWMAREFPDCPFERYADDAVVHCVNRRQAEAVLDAIVERMGEVGLRLHPDKTRIVYCKDDQRRGHHEHTSFTFLGFTFQQRKALNHKTGRIFSSFLPAMSTEALKAKSVDLRALRVHRRTDLTLNDLARWLNPIVAGWMNYYGRFYRSAMASLLERVNTYLRHWAGKKYRRLRTFKRFKRWWAGLLERQPDLFAQWRWVHTF
jgi:RNA-directed DNA polymerase